MITLVKGTDREERDRIQEIGGYVTEQGRVMGDLAVARLRASGQRLLGTGEKPGDRHGRVTDRRHE